MAVIYDKQMQRILYKPDSLSNTHTSFVIIRPIEKMTNYILYIYKDPGDRLVHFFTYIMTESLFFTRKKRLNK